RRGPAPAVRPVLPRRRRPGWRDGPRARDRRLDRGTARRSDRGREPPGGRRPVHGPAPVGPARGGVERLDFSTVSSTSTGGAGWPIFGRDADDVAWRPDPAAAEASRLARFLRSTGEPSLESLQAGAAADSGGVWGAAADDIGIAWQRRPHEVLDLSDGPAWARWW